MAYYNGPLNIGVKNTTPASGHAVCRYREKAMHKAFTEDFIKN